jgi:hypothetical protein
MSWSLAPIPARRFAARGFGLGIVLGVLTSVAGCVSLTPQQRGKVADVQNFADATADAYGLFRIPVTVEPSTNLGLGGRYRQGNFYLNDKDRMPGQEDQRNHLQLWYAPDVKHWVKEWRELMAVKLR